MRSHATFGSQFHATKLSAQALKEAMGPRIQYAKEKYYRGPDYELWLDSEFLIYSGTTEEKKKETTNINIR